jgi:hypothetical protein
MQRSTYDTNKKFATYSVIHDSVEELKEQGALSIFSPDILTPQIKALSAASALSDLADKEWSRVAARPDAFGMPFRKEDGRATWQIFKPKLPDLYIETLSSRQLFQKHLIDQGDENVAWSLSYEAGSAISISLHLAACEQLNLAPVTDSTMHHQLLLQKFTREYYGQFSGSAPVPQKIADLLAHQTAFSLVKNVLPVDKLSEVTLPDILAFRKEMAPHRDRFIRDLTERFMLCKSESKPEALYQLLSETCQAVSQEAKAYENELAKSRDKIWPSFISSLNKTLAPGGVVGAVSFQYIGGPGAVLAGSVVATGLAFLKGLLDIQAEVNAAKRSASPSVAYLSKLKSNAFG